MHGSSPHGAPLYVNQGHGSLALGEVATALSFIPQALGHSFCTGPEPGAKDPIVSGQLLAPQNGYFREKRNGSR